MAGSLNKVMIIGHVGADPEMRYTQNGKPQTRFRVAANSRWRDANGQLQEHTEWFNVLAWEHLAEVCNQYITKGSSVYVEGRLRTHAFDGQDGQRKYWTQVVASTVTFLGRRGDAAHPDGAGDGADAEPPSEDAF